MPSLQRYLWPARPRRQLVGMGIAAVVMAVAAALVDSATQVRRQRLQAMQTPGTVEVMLVKRPEQGFGLPRVSVQTGLDVARCEHLVASLLYAVDDAYIGTVHIGGGGLPGPLANHSPLRLGIRHACATQVADAPAADPILRTRSTA